MIGEYNPVIRADSEPIIMMSLPLFPRLFIEMAQMSLRRFGDLQFIFRTNVNKRHSNKNIRTDICRILRVFEAEFNVVIFLLFYNIYIFLTLNSREDLSNQ